MYDHFFILFGHPQNIILVMVIIVLYKTSSLNNMAKFSWELISVSQNFRMDGGRSWSFHDRVHPDLMILMYWGEKKDLLINAARHSTCYKFADELFPSLDSEI